MTSADPDTLTYDETVVRWRRQMDEALRADEGWLTLAGLHWLREGENRVGAGIPNEIPLPPGSAPARVGTFEHLHGRTTLRLEPGVRATVDGEPASVVEMVPDIVEKPTKVIIGDLTMVVIQRGERFGVRLWDRGSENRTTFPGRRWYPVSEAYRLRARFLAHPTPQALSITTVLGDRIETMSPGSVVFQLHRREASLVAVSGGDEGLFFSFRDATNAVTTYPAGRYLHTDPLEPPDVVLDFNKAYNPPCAFTPYATCPLPPEGNLLSMPIEAGEKFETDS